MAAAARTSQRRTGIAKREPVRSRALRGPVLAAALAALSPVDCLTVGTAAAGEARTQMTVTATVADSFSIRPVHQARILVLTEQDVQRGYAEVPLGSRFEIRQQRPCLFEFRAVGNVFRSVRVTGSRSRAELGAEGGTLLHSASGGGTMIVDMSYRFELARGVRPGTYDWPLSLTVLPL